MGSEFRQLVGLRTGYSRIVSQQDILDFAHLSGDRSPNHVDEEFMRTTPYGRCIAHGALLVACMSRCSTEIVALCGAVNDHNFPVSLGYDRVRFLKAVGAGDEIALDYVISAVDEAKRRTIADVTISDKQVGLVAVATHLMTWIEKS